MQHAAKGPNIVFFVMHLDGFRRSIHGRRLASFQVFPLLKNSCCSEVTNSNLIAFGQQNILRPDLMVDNFLLFVEIIDGFSNLEPVVLNLPNIQFSVNQISKTSVSAVFEHKVKVDLINECVLKFDYVSILQR